MAEFSPKFKEALSLVQKPGRYTGGEPGCIYNEVFTMEDEPLATVVQNMRKGSKWLSAFLESYRPPLDGERYLTDREVAELLRVSRRTLQEYRNNRVLPFILLGGKVLYPESGLRELLEANYSKPME